MRPILVIAVIVAVVVCCSICASGYQIALQKADLRNDLEPVDTPFRQKRQVETFDTDDENMSAPQVEEEGFWDRVVRVAIKLFSRFVEWLNS